MISNLESSWYTRYLGHRDKILDTVNGIYQTVMSGFRYHDPIRMNHEGLHYVVKLNDEEQPVIELDCERTLISEENKLSDSQTIQGQLLVKDQDIHPPTPSYSAIFAQAISALMTEDYHSYSLAMEQVSHSVPDAHLVQSYTNNSSPDAHPDNSDFVMQVHPGYIPSFGATILPNTAPRENIVTTQTPSTIPPTTRIIPELQTPAFPDPVAQQTSDSYSHMSFASITETYEETDIFSDSGYEGDIELSQVPSEPNTEDEFSENEVVIDLELLEAISSISEDEYSDIPSSFTPHTPDYYPTLLESNIISSDQARPSGYENTARFSSRVRRVQDDLEANTPTKSLFSLPKRPLDTEAVELHPCTKKTKRTPPSSPR